MINKRAFDLTYSTWVKDLAGIQPEADVASVYLSLTENAAGFLDAPLFSQFKHGKVFVNTSQGGWL